MTIIPCPTRLAALELGSVELRSLVHHAARFPLSWRHGAPLSVRDVVAELQTRHGETVGDISRGRAAGGFYWRLYKPLAVVVADDPETLRCREAMGQDAVATWGGPYRQRKQAAKAMLYELDKRSISLLGVDDLDLPEWAPAKLLEQS